MRNQDLWKLAVIFALGTSATGCFKPVVGLITSDEKRIWVIRDNREVYRCADGAAPEQPPKPVCIRAPFVETPQ